jgi:general transcription factor 3C polypeptide 5 (transcription factor C subunit 1)
LIAKIRAILVERPVVTRQLLYNRLGWDKRTKLRQAAIYCGFFFESGPWREALVRWGVDPRKDPEFRKYQTVSFLSYLKSGTSKHRDAFDQHVVKLATMSPQELDNEHTFDGVNVSQTGNLFQFCDITDPLIAKILATNDIRTTCAPTFQGWYHVGTWAKATVILKDKMNTIISGETPDDTLYQRVIDWPELWNDAEVATRYKDEVNDRHIRHEKRKEHSIMYSVRAAARNPRYAFEKMEALGRQAQQDQAEEDQDPDDAEIPEDMQEDPVTADAVMNAELEDAEDGEEEQDSEADGDVEIKDKEQNEDVDGDWDVDEDDDDSDTPIITSVRAASEGPAPFGGYYRV